MIYFLKLTGFGAPRHLHKVTSQLQEQAQPVREAENERSKTWCRITDENLNFSSLFNFGSSSNWADIYPENCQARKLEEKTNDVTLLASPTCWWPVKVSRIPSVRKKLWSAEKSSSGPEKQDCHFLQKWAEVLASDSPQSRLGDTKNVTNIDRTLDFLKFLGIWKKSPDSRISIEKVSPTAECRTQI